VSQRHRGLSCIIGCLILVFLLVSDFITSLLPLTFNLVTLLVFGLFSCALDHLLLELIELVFNLADPFEVDLIATHVGLLWRVLHNAPVLGSERDTVVSPLLHVIHLLAVTQDLRTYHELLQSWIVGASMSHFGEHP
jgi:hypothetical protein